MKKAYSRIALALAFTLPLATNGQDFEFILDQAEDIPLVTSQFVAEYQRDINQNIGTAFFNVAQSGLSNLNKNEFSISLVGGSSYLTESNISNPVNLDVSPSGLYYFPEAIPTIFNSANGTDLVYGFIDPATGQPLVDPTTGDNVEVAVGVPGGQGLGFGATPAGTIGVGYGVGANTTIYATFTPMLYSSMGDQFDELSIENDFSFGFHVKHEFGSWVPFLADNGILTSLSLGYNQYSISGNSATIDPTVVDVSMGYELRTSALEFDFSTVLNTTGTRLDIAKRFGFIEVGVFGDYLTSSYTSTSDGTMDVELVNTDMNEVEDSRTLSDFANYDDSVSSMGGGVNITLGQGWFRGTLNYRYSEVQNFGFGLLFVLNRQEGI